MRKQSQLALNCNLEAARQEGAEVGNLPDAWRWVIGCSGAVLLVVGCARKAADPEECLAAAQSWYGLSARSARVKQESGDVGLAQLEANVQAKTLECLTQPYPVEVVRCITQHSRSAACQRLILTNARETRPQGAR